MQYALMGARFADHACPSHLQVEQHMQAQLMGLCSRLEALGDEGEAHVAFLGADLGRLQQSAEDLEVHLLRLEAHAAVAVQDREDAAVSRWKQLVSSQRYRAAVRQLRDGLQVELLDAQAACQQQAAQLAQLGTALEAARSEHAQLAAELQDAHLRSEQALQRAGAERQQALAALQCKVESERVRVQQEAEAASAAAVAAAEERCRVEAAAR